MRATSGTAWRHRSKHVSIVLATILVLCVACDGDGDAGGDDAAGTDELQQVDFRLDWVIGGEHAAYALGIDKGFFSEEGLDVTMREGTGSSVTVSLAGNGTIDFGNADTPPVILGVEQGIPIRMVANFSPTSAFGFVYVKGETPDLTEVTDLQGLTIGVHPGTSEASVLPFALSSNDVDPQSDVEIVQGDAMFVALAQGRIDALMCLITCLPTMESVDSEKEYGYLDLRDFGIDLQAHGIIANSALTNSDPELVRSFVRAAQRSWAYVLEDETHAGEAVEATIAMFPEADSAEITTQLENHLSILRDVVESQPGEPVGWMNEDTWKATQEVMAVISEGEAEIVLPIEGYYTNEFLSDDIVVDTP